MFAMRLLDGRHYRFLFALFLTEVAFYQIAILGGNRIVAAIAHNTLLARVQVAETFAAPAIRGEQAAFLGVTSFVNAFLSGWFPGCWLPAAASACPADCRPAAAVAAAAAWPAERP